VMSGTLALFGLIGAAFLGLVLCFSLPSVRYLERTPSIVIGVIVLLYVLSTLYPGDMLPPLPLGGFSVFPMDILSMVLVGLAFPRYYFFIKNGFGKKEKPLLLLLIWAAVLALNFVFGILEFDIQNATNEFRNFLYVVCVGLYVASLDLKKLWPLIERSWLWGAFGLCIIAIVGFSDGDLSHAGRPLTATGTLFLLQAFVVALFAYKRGSLSRMKMLLCFGLLPLILILQHRSVWVVTACSFGLIALLVPSLRAMIVKWGTIGGVFFTILISVFFGERIYEALVDSYEEAFSERSTFSWRIQGWLSLLTGEHMDSPREILLGNTFGTGYAREFIGSDGQRIEVEEASPHNFYIQVLLRSGTIGLVVFLALHYSLMRKLYRMARMEADTRFVSLCLLVILFGQCVFFIPYGFNAVSAMFLGFSIAGLRKPELLRVQS